MSLLVDPVLLCLQLLMNIPFMAIYFASYEGAKQALINHSRGEETLLIQVRCDAIPGCRLLYDPQMSLQTPCVYAVRPLALDLPT